MKSFSVPINGILPEVHEVAFHPFLHAPDALSVQIMDLESPNLATFTIFHNVTGEIIYMYFVVGASADDADKANLVEVLEKLLDGQNYPAAVAFAPVYYSIAKQNAPCEICVPILSAFDASIKAVGEGGFRTVLMSAGRLSSAVSICANDAMELKRVQQWQGEFIFDVAHVAGVYFAQPYDRDRMGRANAVRDYLSSRKHKGPRPTFAELSMLPHLIDLEKAEKIRPHDRMGFPPSWATWPCEVANIVPYAREIQHELGCTRDRAQRIAEMFVHSHRLTRTRILQAVRENVYCDLDAVMKESSAILASLCASAKAEEEK